MVPQYGPLTAALLALIPTHTYDIAVTTTGDMFLGLLSNKYIDVSSAVGFT